MYRIIIIILFLTFGISVSASEADEIRAELDGKLGLNNQGTEFWLSVPDMFYLNDVETFHLLITSANENTVTIKYLNTGKDSIFKLEANSAKLIQLYPSRDYGYYFDQDEKGITKKLELAGINIITESPVTVQTLNNYYGFKNATIIPPKSSLGKVYMIQSYPSTVFDDEGIIRKISPPEITITSPYNDNSVKLILAKSNNNLSIKLEDSTEYYAGDTVEVMMQKGDVFYVHSSDTLGDLSGSLIKSSKPIHLTYSHYVLRLHNNPNRNNDIHTTIFPNEQWGKEYFIPSFSELNKHPVIRVYTQHDDTKIYRNGELWTSIGNTYENEVFESSIWPNDYEYENDEPTIITSDKPISLLIFPDYKKIKDSVNIINDNVSTLIPTAQFVNRACFSLLSSWLTNPDSEYKKNMFEIYYISNKDEITKDIELAISKPNSNLIEWKSLNLDTSGVFESTEINDIYYCRYKIGLPDSCTVYIKSEKVLFNGFYYNVDYGGIPFIGPNPPTIDYLAFPISTNGLDLTSSDTTTPKVTLTQMNNSTHGIVYDFDESASGLAELYMLNEYSHNYNYKLLSADRGFLIDEEENSFIPGEPVQLEFELTKKDPNTDAFAVLYTTDKAGNDTLVFVNEELFTSVESETEIDQFVSVTNDELIFDNPVFNSKINKLSLFDINGSVVKSIEKLKMNRMDIDELNSGTYFLLIRTADRIYTKKLSVVK